MKTKIPKGWGKLRKGTMIEKGDMFLSGNGTWRKAYFSGVDKVGWDEKHPPMIKYFRKIKKRGGK